MVPRRIAVVAGAVLLSAACSSDRELTAAVPLPARSAPSAPSTASPTGTLPASSTTVGTPSPRVVGSPPPVPVRDAGFVARPGDGIWSPAGRPVGTGPAVYTTILHRASRAAPIAVGWLDTVRLRVALYAGFGQPSGAWPQEAAVPPSLRNGLVAAFNSGFKVGASRGGWYLDGPGGVVGTKLLPTMSFSALHFLTPFWRDFFAVFART